MIPAREKLLLLIDKIVGDWAGIAIERPSVMLAGFEQTYGCYWCGKEVVTYEKCACDERHAPWSRVIRLGNYEPPLSECILCGKYAAWDVGLEYLGAMLGRQIRGCVPPNSILVPVPMPLSRRFFRGINHTKELAHHASRTSGMPMRCSLWRREGVPQASKTASARLKMKHNSMLMRPLARVRGKNIVLIDDVLTTGKTIEIAANTLRRAGVLSVRVAVLAVTKMPKKR